MSANTISGNSYDLAFEKTKEVVDCLVGLRTAKESNSTGLHDEKVYEFLDVAFRNFHKRMKDYVASAIKRADFKLGDVEVLTLVSTALVTGTANILPELISEAIRISFERETSRLIEQLSIGLKGILAKEAESIGTGIGAGCSERLGKAADEIVTEWFKAQDSSLLASVKETSTAIEKLKKESAVTQQHIENERKVQVQKTKGEMGALAIDLQRLTTKIALDFKQSMKSKISEKYTSAGIAIGGVASGVLLSWLLRLLN